MVVKENEITELIEDKMGFKFEDLELVGKFNKYVSSCFKIVFYKYEEDFFMELIHFEFRLIIKSIIFIIIKKIVTKFIIRHF